MSLWRKIPNGSSRGWATRLLGRILIKRASLLSKIASSRGDLWGSRRSSLSKALCESRCRLAYRSFVTLAFGWTRAKIWRAKTLFQFCYLCRDYKIQYAGMLHLALCMGLKRTVTLSGGPNVGSTRRELQKSILTCGYNGTKNLAYVWRLRLSCCLWNMPSWLRKHSHGLLFCCRLRVGCCSVSFRTCFYNCVQMRVRKKPSSCYSIAGTDIVRTVKSGNLSFDGWKKKEHPLWESDGWLGLECSISHKAPCWY